VEHLVPKERNFQVPTLKKSSLLGIILVESKVVSPFICDSLPEEETLGKSRLAPPVGKKSPDYNVSLLPSLPGPYQNSRKPLYKYYFV
jgi:hypothetical protein